MSAIEGQDLRYARAASERGGGRCVGRTVPATSVAVIPADAGPVGHWPEAEPLPAHEVGEITVRGPLVSRTYYGRPDADAQAKIPDGPDVWHRTGDLGRTDDEEPLVLRTQGARRAQSRRPPVHRMHRAGVQRGRRCPAHGPGRRRQ